jgi:hypothetical protein
MTKIRVGSEYTPPENAYVGDGGVFPVTLIGIGEERDSDGQFGPKVVQEWRFAIDDPTSPFEGQLLFDGWVTAPKDGQVHPKSNYYGYMTALFGGRTAPEGTEIDIETQLIGRQALATVVRNDNGSMRITNLGAMPTLAAPAPAPAVAAAAPVQQQPTAAVQQAPAAQPLREQVAASPDGLPF